MQSDNCGVELVDGKIIKLDRFASCVGTWMALLKQKKGPLAVASSPSLGRKRPRRAAVTRGATAPQQHATAAHKKQVFLTYYLYNFCMAGLPYSGAGTGRRGLPFSVILSMAYVGIRGIPQGPVQVAFESVSSKGAP